MIRKRNYGKNSSQTHKKIKFRNIFDSFKDKFLIDVHVTMNINDEMTWTRVKQIGRLVSMKLEIKWSQI